MKKLKIGALVALLFLMGIICTFSNCEDTPIKIDPCAEKNAVTASFTIYENVSDSLFVADTVLQYNTIVFSADENYDSYEWTVGDDARIFTTKKFHLSFQQPVGKIDVTLKVTKAPDAKCFPEDDGVDVLTKSFVVIDWRNSLTIGEYEGVNISKPSEKFEIKITREFDVNNHPIYNLENINKGCLDTRTPSRGGKIYRFSDLVWYGEGCKGVEGWITLSTPDSIRIDYSYGDSSKPFTPQGYPRIEETFKGKRK